MLDFIFSLSLKEACAAGWERVLIYEGRSVASQHDYLLAKGKIGIDIGLRQHSPQFQNSHHL
jgi:hypothetical protein